MAPIFKKVKEMTTSRGKTSSGSGSSGWNHTRIQDGKTGSSQKPWRKESEEASAPPGYIASDNAPLTTHKEWTDKDSENDLTNRPRSDVEMQTLPKIFYHQ
jgi:hypothetical protein